MKDIFKLKCSFVLITGDFNCRNSSWYLGDPVTPQGALVEALTFFYGLNQLIKTPTRLHQNSATSIDLVVTNQPHLVIDSGVHSSLSSTCHHKIVFAKLSLKVEDPPPYERIFWYYFRADKASINQAINAINWDELFANKTVESQVSELNDLLLNIYSNYIPNKTVLCDDKDPSWMTNGIRTAIEMKNNAYKEYIRSGMRHNYYLRLENLTTELSNLVHDTKTEYFFSIWVFFHDHSRITGLQRKGESISLTPHYNFHPLHRHLDISRAITAESLPLHIASSRARAGNLWFPSASR